MTKLIFIQSDGEKTEIDAEIGSCVMEAAVNNDIPVILAECGGSCICGTCHAYVEASRLNELPEPSEFEQELLEGSLKQQNNSRLTCQITVTESMEGMVFRLPDKQY